MEKLIKKLMPYAQIKKNKKNIPDLSVKLPYHNYVSNSSLSVNL